MRLLVDAQLPSASCDWFRECGIAATQASEAPAARHPTPRSRGMSNSIDSFSSARAPTPGCGSCPPSREYQQAWTARLA